LSKQGYEIETLDPSLTRWEFGGVTFEVLSPLADFDESLPANESSTVLRLSYAGYSILLTGDIEDRTQQALLQRGDLHADVLLLPHHGSMRSNSADFFRAVDPSLAIRSSNHAMHETFNGLQEALGGISLYNTADVGAIKVVIDHSGVHVSGMRPDADPSD
jgi:competence protein ComEC